MENRPRRRPNRSLDGFVVPENKQPLSKDAIQPIKKPLQASLTSQKARINTLESSSKTNNNYPINNLNMAKTKTLKTKPKRSKKKIIILGIVAIFILGIGFLAWDAWQLYHKLHRLNVGNLAASVGGAENILVAGSTNRCDQKVQNAQWGFCSEQLSGVNSDIIFIIHLVPSTHTVSLLSIPRDTFVPNARSGNKAFKIDAALYQGPTQLVTAVEQDFGIPIQHYVEVGFDGFVNIVNAIGGIKVNFPMPVYDAESYLNVQQPGCHELNGIEALQLVRARHLQYKPSSITTNDVNYWPQEALSDIARIARTHEFLKILASTIAAKGISNPITDQKLIDAIAPQVQVDSGFSTSTMFDLMQYFKSVNINSVPQYTLPIVTPNFGLYYYQGYDMGDVVFPVEQTDQQIIDKFLGTTNTINTMTGKPLPLPQSINVNVINGSGTANQAGNISNGLQKLGFNISSQPTNTTPVSPQAQETVVYYASQSTEGDALAVAAKLTGYVVLAQDSNKVTPGSEITVVTGTNAAIIGQPATGSATNGSSTGSSTGSISSSSNTTSSSPISPSQGTISSANQPLAPWDPTACTSKQPIVPNNANF